MGTKTTRLGLLLLLLAAPLTACSRGVDRPEPGTPPSGADTVVEEQGSDDVVQKSEAAWREALTPLEYHVLREKGTERAFTGKYWNEKTPGTYHCKGCGAPLFRSDAKFDSGCGWPSFFEPLDGARLVETLDTSHGMIRTEITCRRCGAHLGHVFEDGPEPTGLRYCINSVSIDLKPEAKPPTAR